MSNITRVAIFLCGTKKRVRTSKTPNLRGMKFGRWIVVRYAGIRKRIRTWICECSCGNRRVVREDHLISKNSKSCGCAVRESCSILGRLSRTHGKSGTKIYATWRSMLDRCENQNSKYYSRYGGRGIKVCKRWHKFENFYSDMGDKPTPAHTLDRIDNGGNYCKENCRWATRKEQQRNRYANHDVTFRGKTKCISAWSEETGIAASTIANRIARGWKIRYALTMPIVRI